MLPFPFRFRFVSRWKRKRNGKLSFPKIEKRNGNETELTETAPSLTLVEMSLLLSVFSFSPLSLAENMDKNF